MEHNRFSNEDLQDRPNEVLRHPDFWLRDGSIILSVQHVLFKVHQTILAQHSEIFADLFDLPQPDPEAGGDELIEGCRVVQLQDSPEDFEDLLRAIYHLDHFDTLSPAASLDDVLVFVTGILRLSTKYMIRGLRAKCIKLLSGRFPTTYDEYLARSPLPRPYSPPAHRSGIDQNAINNLIELTHLTLNSLSDHATANVPNSTFHRSNRPRRSQQVSVTLNPANPPPAFPSHGGGASAPINTSVYAYGWQPTTNDGTGLPGGWPPSQPADLSLPGSAPASVANNPQWNTQPPPNPPPSAPATQATTSASSTPPAQAGSATSQQSHSHGRHTHRHKSKHKTDSPKTAADAPKPTASSVMRAIAVAYEGRVYSILPYAYYLLARTSSPRRFLSKGNAAPTAASSSNPNVTTTGSGGGSGVNGLPTISWQEKTICLVGRALLRSAELSMSHSFLVAFQPSPSCRQPSRCSNSRGPLLEWALLEAAGKGPEPLKGWDRWDKLGVCQECVGECMRKHEAGRREVWERLPEFFDLEAWAKLRDLQDS